MIMDYSKIGKYINTKRKVKCLTQAKLAEKLFVSEKTISKWENGKGLPDTEVLPKLCEILGISINELLNGEDVKNEEYTCKAESKLLELQKQKELSDKRLLISEIVLGGIATIYLLIIMGVALYLAEVLQLEKLSIILIVIGMVLFVIGCIFALYIEQKAGYYLCRNCDHKYVPNFKQIMFAPHICRTRYMKCPKCKKRSWHKKTIK